MSPMNKFVICLALVAIVPTDALHLKKKLPLLSLIPFPTIPLNKPEGSSTTTVKPEVTPTTPTDVEVVESAANFIRYQPIPLQYFPYYQPLNTGIPTAFSQPMVYNQPTRQLFNLGSPSAISHQNVVRFA
ncbi:hypothetical protein ACFFRR_011241 [Megaselia abdita]